MQYDFVLFEHTPVVNHQHDLEEIARLLIHQGKKVAIAEVYNECYYCKDTEIEHFVFDKPFKERFLFEKECGLVVKRHIHNRLVRRKYDQYLKYVLLELCKVTSNVYIGSFFNNTTYSWLYDVPSSINIYVWGLRSFWQYEYKLNPFSKSGVYSFLNRNLLDKKKNIKLFVSNEIIKNEFLNLGIDQERIVVRPERTISKIAKSVSHNKQYLMLLTIGSLRPDKRIELALEALRVINSNEIKYTIAGATFHDSKYEEIISKHIRGLKNIERINSRLSDEDYSKVISDCDFLVLCDKQHPSCITNGTMNEALLMGKPIIAPNYNPYKYIIDKFGVGIVFNPESIDSLVSAILEAKEKGVGFFAKSIEDYQKTLLIDNASEVFVKQLKLD